MKKRRLEGRREILPNQSEQLGLDAALMRVADQLDVVHREAVDVMDFGIDPELRSPMGITRQLLSHLFQVRTVDMAVVQGNDELIRDHTNTLCNYMQKDCIGGDVERHPEEHIT